jgi:TonB-dependent starch-binding outer membrane protein SusC
MNIKIPTKKLTVLLAFSMFCFMAIAQKTITGTVVDEKGVPLTGVNVGIKGTTIASITDFVGKYSLSKVNDNAILTVSFIGFIGQEIPVGTRRVVDVTMKEDTKALDEIVVIGYGTQKKRDLTGSVGSVSTKALNMKGSSTMMESLQGQTPGVSITQNSSRAGGGFDIQIRGVQSITNTATAPLYVVDGIVVSDIQFLNPADIERVDVLKDASSTAIYGSRASNGVVMVTTKSAKTQGGQASKPVISYDAYVGTRQVARTPDFMSGMEFMQYRFNRYTTNVGRKSKNGSVKYSIVPANLQITLLTNALPDTTTGTQLLGNLDTRYPAGGTLYASNVEKLMAEGEEYDWLDLVTQDATQQNHYLSVSGAAGGTNYHFGMGYQQDQGIFLKDNETRYNLKAAIDTRISDFWTAGISLNLARTIDDWGSSDAVANALWSNPYFIPYDENGVNYLQSGVTKTLGTAGGAQFSSMINPLVDMENTVNGAIKLHVLGNIYLQFSPIKNLSFKTTLSPNLYQGRTHYYATINTTARNSAGTDRAEVKTTNMFDYTWDNQVNYTLTKGEHSFNAMGLFSMNKYTKETFNQYGEKFPSNNTYYNMSTAGTMIACESGYTENSLMSYAARLNYSYMGKYMVTGTIRADGSSRFAAGNQWGAFPSAAFAWRASEEEFLKQDWLNNLKLRVSYGVSGNNNVGDYVTATMPSSVAYYAWGSTMGYGYGPNGIVNADLRWERTAETNFGVDLSLFGNRINLTTEIYNKLSNDLLMQRSLALEAGGGATVTDNIGSVSNKGIELSLNTVNIQTKDLRWETTINFSKNTNAIEELYGGTVTQDLGNNWFVGSPVNVFYNYTLGGVVDDRPLTVTLPKDLTNATLKDGTNFSGLKGDQVTFAHAYEFYYATYGLYEGMPIIKDLEYDGIIDAKDKSIIGKALPDWTGSISTTLTYKNWDLSASAYAKMNYMVSSPFIRQYMAYNDRGRSHINFDYYIPAGTPILNADGTIGKQAETHYGTYPYPTDAQDNGGSGSYFGTSGIAGIYYLVDASFIKVKNISLGYTVPKSISNKLGIGYLRLYGNVLNPFVFTDYKGFDPEWAGSALSSGGPSTISYQIGINAKF